MAHNDLALRRIDHGITVASAGRMVWYALGPQRWSFQTAGDRQALIDSAGLGYAGLVGRKIHLRVTSRPYPVDEWAKSVSGKFPMALPGWGRHIVAEQRQLLGMMLSSKEVYLGVGVKTAPARRSALRDELAKIDAAVSTAGLAGRRALPREIEYLLHRSVSLGAPAPLTLPPESEVWEPEDLGIFTDHTTWTVQPFGRTVQVMADVNGHLYRRHVAVVTVGPMQDLPIPEVMEPWLQRSDRLSFPVEWSVQGEIVPPEKVRAYLRHTMHKIKAQLAHNEEHDETPPAALARQHERAVQVEDELSRTDPRNNRFFGRARAAVSGATEEEAISRAQTLLDLYTPHITLHRTKSQHGVAREFIPGQPLDNKAHLRRMPVTTLAGAMPNAANVIGNKSGYHIGSTVGAARRAVLWHPWQSTEVGEGSGVTVVTGTLGAGKSTLLGVIAYWSALAGVPTVIFDPSGPLARIAMVPELRDYAAAIDLMDAEPGSLNPYAMVPDPLPEHYLADRVPGMTDEQWQHESEILFHRAVRSAQATRRMLVVDTLMSLLPLQLVEDPATHKAVTEAARQVPNTRMSSPRQILANLHKQGDHGVYVARTLEDMAELPQVQLIFPEGLETPAVTNDDLVLQVLTMRGIVLPTPGKPRQEWTINETVGVPLMTLSAYLASQHIYGADMNARKLYGIDEVHALTQVAIGQTYLRTISRDTRKFNARVMLCGQNPGDALTAGISNLLDSGFVGRTIGQEEQQTNLRMLQIATGDGYEAVLAGLSPRERQSDQRSGFREFIWNDGDGGIEKIRIDVPESLKPYIDTTADPTRVSRPRLSVLKGSAVGE